MNADMSVERERILNSAIEMFSRFGLAKTTLGQIAKAAECNLYTLYRHFPNKETLVVAAFQNISRQYQSALDVIKETDAGLEERLRKVLGIRHVFFTKYFMLNLWNENVAIRFSANDANHALSEMKMQDLSYYKELFSHYMDKREITPSDPVELAELFLSSITGLMLVYIAPLLYKPIPKKLAGKIHQQQLLLLRMFINGLKV